MGAIAIALGTLWFSGCTAARDTLGTNSSPCFRALALADIGSGSGLHASLDGDLDSDDGEPLTWAEVERQLERAARAERRGRAGPSRSPES